MNRILAWVFILVNVSAFSQLRKADSYIQKLNNNQFVIDHSQKAGFKMQSPAALKLIKIGKPASEKLIKALSDTSKTIMVQLVLSHIYFKQVSFAGPKVLVTNEGDLSKYYLGEEKGVGLVISETNINGIYHQFVTSSDLQEVISFWKKRIADK
ncbi:MAG: hypothetical protein H0W61_13930 [Bacteroidetes bacterium]|nr:hypothetical protein [Bacteroidota bacterium]